MILIALGANLPSHAGPPRVTCERALEMFPRYGLTVVACSFWYETPAWPDPAQPMFVNGVAQITTVKTPAEALAALHAVENAFGRKRGECGGERNAPRSLDLDLLAYGDIVQEGPPSLPHPRMTERGFVLKPLCDVAPNWRHPVSGERAADLLAKIEQSQTIKRI